MTQVWTLGELLIDFVPDRSGVTLAQADRFIKAAGGAPANVAVGVSRLGVASGFIGKVGDDPFGHWLAEVLRADDVDVRQLRFDTAARTALAFVTLTAEGEREFMFYRHPSADQLHRPGEIDDEAVASADILHHGSISLIQSPSREATLHAVEVARAAGRTISYDPNLRPALWPDDASARQAILEAWPRAHLIKVSEDELAFLTGSREPAAARELMHDDLRLLMVTRGAEGVAWFTRNDEGEEPGVRVEPVDTTGAGDAFMAAMLAACVRAPRLYEDREALTEALRRANAYAALTTTRHGAIPGLPTREALAGFVAAG
ncbi:MAG: PfkB family carbohydrate kinase [Trueperaceae bacterium]|nr:PfkB family carbohydrate kinase [Trueperaceae bacterium]